MNYSEPISRDNKDRFVIFPNKHQDIWDRYKEFQASLWSVTDLKLKEGPSNEISAPNLRDFQKGITYLAIVNRLLNRYLTRVILAELSYPEAEFFYSLQNMMEHVHLQTYAELLEFSGPGEQREYLVQFMEKSDEVQALCSELKSLRNASLAERLVSFASLSDLLISPVLFSLLTNEDIRKNPGVTKGLTAIAGNIAMSRDFSLHIHKHHLVKPLSPQEIFSLVLRKFEVTKLQFTRLSADNREKERMLQFQKFSLDQILKQMGHPSQFGEENPYEFLQNHPQPQPGLAQRRVSTIRQKTGKELHSEEEPEPDRDI